MPAKSFLDLEQKVKLQKALKEEENSEIKEAGILTIYLKCWVMR